MIENIHNILNHKNIQLIEAYENSHCYPSCILLIEFPKLVKSTFICMFSSKIMICKILPLFYVQHEFEIENQSETKIAPVLDGFGGQAYIQEQFGLHEEIKKSLLKENYIELSFLKMNELITHLSFREDIRLFGNQVTLEYALFHDILDLCSND